MFINKKLKLKRNVYSRLPIHIETPLKLETQNTAIPLKIFQSWHTKSLPPKMQNCVDRLKRENPEFEFFLFDDNDCRIFIQNNFPIEILDTFDKLIPGAFKIDLWRLCVLYIFGGIYIDIKYQCVNGFKFIQVVNKGLCLISDGITTNDSSDTQMHTHHIYNGVLISPPKNDFILTSIIRLVYNVSIDYRGETCFDITGPGMFQTVYKEFEDKYPIQMTHLGPVENERIIYNNKVILTHYNEYRQEQKQYQQSEHYSILWKENKIYNDIVVNIPNIVSMNTIRTFCIYFPQFHVFPENDYNFYKDYTDITNVEKLIEDNVLDKDYLTPSYSELDLTNITDYNLLNETIIQKQIDILASCNMEGFAIYYYWFSVNSITNKHQIMESVIDKFFGSTIDMKDRKIFLIWANEDWSKNCSFSTQSTTVTIENVYDTESFNKNIDTLMQYFIHENYLKVNNKPVFFLHHPSLLDDSSMLLFQSILDTRCRENGFDGILLNINSSKKIENIETYDCNVKLDSNSFERINDVITYNYMDKVFNNKLGDNINTIMYNFDNQARMYSSNRLNHRWKFTNSIELLHELYTTKIIKHYLSKSSDAETKDILLINSWNEWGENMAIEPSNEKNYYFLNLLQRCFFQNVYFKYLANKV
jgi:mannosyltransferase OCH1-like enzyme